MGNNGCMGLFTRRQSGSQLSTEELEGLQTLVGARVRVLSVGRGKGAVVAALEQDFAVRRTEWELIGWHEIQHGAWDSDTSELEWHLVAGDPGRVTLTEPGNLPEVFVAQVGRTIVVQHRLVVPDDLGNVVIAGRQALGPGAPVVWLVQASGRTDLEDPRVELFVLEQTGRLKEEYEAAR